MKRIIEYLLLGICLVVLTVAGIWLYEIWSGYHKAENEYDKLRKYVVESEPKSDEENESEKQENEKLEQALSVDFEELKRINPDIVAWIRIEAAGIDYPVVQGKDNEYYLHHTFKGEENIAGSIFMDYRNTPDFSDENTIIYGHNMRDGSMFAALNRLQIGDKPLAEIVTEHGGFIFQLYKESHVSLNDEIYQFNPRMIDFQSEKRNVQESIKKIILSTCSNDSSERYIIKGKSVD